MKSGDICVCDYCLHFDTDEFCIIKILKSSDSVLDTIVYWDVQVLKGKSNSVSCRAPFMNLRELTIEELLEI